MNAQQHVDLFNADFPVGTPVKVRKDDGTDFDSEVTAPACLLSGHTPVVWLKDIRGCYLLSRVSAR
jgi:hypothetical protein